MIDEILIVCAHMHESKWECLYLIIKDIIFQSSYIDYCRAI